MLQHATIRTARDGATQWQHDWTELPLLLLLFVADNYVFGVSYYYSCITQSASCARHTTLRYCCRCTNLCYSGSDVIVLTVAMDKYNPWNDRSMRVTFFKRYTCCIQPSNWTSYFSQVVLECIGRSTHDTDPTPVLRLLLRRCAHGRTFDS